MDDLGALNPGVDRRSRNRFSSFCIMMGRVAMLFVKVLRSASVRLELPVFRFL